MKFTSSLTKIVIFVKDFRLAGAETVAVNLANAYSNMGFEVQLLALQANGPLKNKLEKKIKIKTLNKQLYTCFYSLRQFLIKLDSNTIFISTIRNLNIATGIALFFRRHNFIIIFREANTYNQLIKGAHKNLFKYFFYKFFVNFTYELASLVVANSRDTKVDLFSLLLPQKRLKVAVDVIGNPIFHAAPEQNDVMPLEFMRKKRIGPVILSIGRLHVQKDFNLGIKSFYYFKKKFPDSIYVILGEGPLKPNLISYAHSLSLIEEKDIFFIDPVTNPSYFYNFCDIFFLTSKWEGFGNVIVEAMQCGKTSVIAKCRGAPRDIVNRKYGYFINSRDPLKLSRALIMALNYPVDYNALIERARNFDCNKIAMKYISIRGTS